MNGHFSALCGDRAKVIYELGAQLSVIAVHSQSVYMRAPDGRLLLLCPDKYGKVPFGLAIKNYDLFRAYREYTEGERATLERGALCFSDGCEITFELVESNGIAHTSSRLPCARQLRFAQEYAYTHASRRGMTTVLGAFLCTSAPCADATTYALAAASEADRLEQGFFEGDLDLLSLAIRRFIGLGYGLTPSGDDFVCGMAYVFNRYKNDISSSRQYLKLLRESVLALLDRTSEVSREYIRCALDGERFDVVDGVLDCFSGDVSDQGLSARLELLLEVGASSGSDILCGMLFAFYLLLLDSEEI